MEDQPKSSLQEKNIVILSDFNDGATLCHVDKALKQAEKDLKPEDIDKNELPLDVTTPDEELGEKWNAIDTLRLLFRNSLLSKVDPSLIKYRILGDGIVLPDEENYYPVRHDPKRLTPELLETFMAYAGNLLPSADDPDFVSALRHRISGVFNILHRFTHLIDEIGNPVLVLRWFASVMRDDEDKQKINVIPWEQRQQKLEQRMDNVEASVYVLRAEYKANLIAGEIGKISDLETKETLNALFRTFWDRINKCPFLQDNSVNPLSRYKYLHAVVNMVRVVLKKSKNLDTFRKLLIEVTGRLPNIKDTKAAQELYDWLRKSEEMSPAAS